MIPKEKEMIVLSRIIDVFVDIDVSVVFPFSISIRSLPTSIMQIYIC